MSDNSATQPPTTQAAPVEATVLLWSRNVGRILDWATTTLGLTESWRAEGGKGGVEHGELLWQPDQASTGNRITISFSREPYTKMGPSGISLRTGERAVVDELHDRAATNDAEIIQGLEDSRVAYSFTARDPDGNQWWVNAETGFLDKLRDPG